MSTTRIKIESLRDATDTAHLEKALEAVPHVRSVTIESRNHEAVIEHDGADVRQLTTALAQLGYDARAS